MPIKNGEKLICSVINPLSLNFTDNLRRETIKIYEKEMSSSRLDVVIKKQNTMKFLAEADSQVAEYQKLQKEFFAKHLHLPMLR